PYLIRHQAQRSQTFFRGDLDGALILRLAGARLSVDNGVGVHSPWTCEPTNYRSGASPRVKSALAGCGKTEVRQTISHDGSRRFSGLRWEMDVRPRFFRNLVRTGSIGKRSR